MENYDYKDIFYFIRINNLFLEYVSNDSIRLTNNESSAWRVALNDFRRKEDALDFLQKRVNYVNSHGFESQVIVKTERNIVRYETFESGEDIV